MREENKYDKEDIQMKKIVFFGGGPMGEGIMGGLIRGKVVEPQQITVSELAARPP